MLHLPAFMDSMKMCWLEISHLRENCSSCYYLVSNRAAGNLDSESKLQKGYLVFEHLKLINHDYRHRFYWCSLFSNYQPAYFIPWKLLLHLVIWEGLQLLREQRVSNPCLLDQTMVLLVCHLAAAISRKYRPSHFWIKPRMLTIIIGCC